MVEFRVVISDPKEGKSYQVNVTGQHANVLVRKRIGEEIDGMFVGLPGYKLKITGGSDRDGFAMRSELPTSGRKRLLVADSTGFHPALGGMRRKKSFRGNEVGLETAQINTMVVTHGPKPVAELVPKKEEKK
ncbi:MAG TPA: 30S ribosomal protein S6e [Candidatus Thermoplasmatota archaeon]|nr:30S ribosomal protein S6e [Candidatus Thermoplasmatota archaeon]